MFDFKHSYIGNYILLLHNVDYLAFVFFLPQYHSSLFFIFFPFFLFMSNLFNFCLSFYCLNFKLIYFIVIYIHRIRVFNFPFLTVLHIVSFRIDIRGKIFIGEFYISVYRIFTFLPFSIKYNRHQFSFDLTDIILICLIQSFTSLIVSILSSKILLFSPVKRICRIKFKNCVYSLQVI